MAADTETFSDPDPFTAVCVCVCVFDITPFRFLTASPCVSVLCQEKKLDLQLSDEDGESWKHGGIKMVESDHRA